MTEKEMVALNNERRKELTKENKTYYENMLVYLRTSRIPSKKTEELLLEMLDHLLTAQREGRSAQEVFGQDPKDYCEEIVASMGKQRLFSWRRYVWMFSLSLYIGFLIDGVIGGIFRLLNPLFGLPEREGVPLTTLASPFLSIFLIEAVFFFMRWSTFEKAGKRLLFWYVPAIMLLYALPFAGVLLLLLTFGDVMPVLPITPWTSLLIGMLLYLFHRQVFKRVDID